MKKRAYVVKITVGDVVHVQHIPISSWDKALTIEYYPNTHGNDYTRPDARKKLGWRTLTYITDEEARMLEVTRRLKGGAKKEGEDANI
tara:strand:- start:36 stop:299 length:264 start_codon:yes stop_codon:yes gene_type:complete